MKLPKDIIKKILYVNEFAYMSTNKLIFSDVICAAECGICYSSVYPIYCHGSCKICEDCWTIYVNTTHNAKKCPICELCIIPLVLSDAELMREYIRCKIYYCSYCGSANKKKGKEYKRKCSNELCRSRPNNLCKNNCGFISHAPACCEAVITWNQVITSQTPDDIYIKSIAKACPKCAAFIIKDSEQSCLKMHCTSCEFVFCWKCLSDYVIHSGDFYKCDIYRDDKSEIIKQAIQYESDFSGNIFLKKYLRLALNYLKQEYYTNVGFCNKYEFNKFINIMNVLNHDFEGFKNTTSRLQSLYKLLKKNENISFKPYVPKPPDSIIYWDADYDHNNLFIAHHMENILNNSMLNIYFDIGETELATEHYYINFTEMTIEDINHPPIFKYNITLHLLSPWNCNICTMHNFPKATRVQRCSVCDTRYNSSTQIAL
jgi:hypothetical protein